MSITMTIRYTKEELELLKTEIEERLQPDRESIMGALLLQLTAACLDNSERFEIVIESI